jgi:hypothetical protein
MFAHLAYYVNIWFRNFLSLRGAAPLFTPLGGAIFVVHASDALFAGTPEQRELLSAFNQYWYLFFAAGIVMAIWSNWPVLRFSSKLGGRDVRISLVIDDILKLNGAIVMGSNTTFDVDVRQNLISKNSVQGKFSEQYYDGTLAIEAEVTAGLNNIPFETLTGQRVGKSARYPIGTVVKLTPKGRTGYLLAISNLNEHGVASGTFDDLKTALAELWVYLGSKGSKDEQVLIPILGTGFGRLRESREAVFREIVRSFVAACSESSFCDDLTIVLHGDDLAKHKMEFKDLCEFLNSVCKYTEFAPANAPPVGAQA